MSLINVKLLAAFFILALTILSAWIPFRKRLHQKQEGRFTIGEALASGIFLGAGLIHMLAEANFEFHQAGIHYPVAFLLAGASFLFLLFLEHVAMEAKHHQKPDGLVISMLALLMLSIHSLLEGMALGFTDSLIELSILFIAITAHKWAASFSLAVKINQTHLNVRHGLLWFGLFALMTPIGIGLAILFIPATGELTLAAPVFTALAAGTFIYIGTLHGLQRSFMIERCCNIKELGWVIVGFSIMALAALLDIH